MKKMNLMLLLSLTVIAVFAWVPGAKAQSSYFTSCTACHVGQTVSSCSMCHAHGTHSSSAKSDINLKGQTVDANGTSKTSFAPGETIYVKITGGYKAGSARITLYGDSTTTVLARSSGTLGSGEGPVNAPSFSNTTGITLSSTAPVTPGTYTWNVSWYGNVYDKSGAAFGSRWVADSGNPEHGEEIVATNSFTVTAPAAPSITLAPATLDFGTIATSSTLITQIQNTGTSVLNVTAIALCNGTSTEFSWTPSAPFSVAAGASQALAVTYLPTGDGSDTGCLQLSTNDPVTNPATLSLSGTGVTLQPVRINYTVPTYFATLQAAYDSYKTNPVAGVAIQATQGSLIGDLNLTDAVDVALDGGYDSGYSGNVSSYTTIIGTVTIGSGSATVSNIIISS